MAITQQNRMAAIGISGQADDTLCLKSFSGHEELGRLFQYEVELVSDNASIKFEDIIGQNATIRLNCTTTNASGPRFFNGYISQFTQLPSTRYYAVYHATLVPWFWFLTRSSDCRIWSGADKLRSVPDIIKDLFGEYGFAVYDNKLSGTYTNWDFCVQYRETDFNFISRIMEQEGIYYYFKHENGKHTLVLTDAIDDTSQNPPFPGYDEIHFKAQGPGSSDLECVRDWTLTKQLHAGKYTHKDFDFTNSKKDLTTAPAQKNRTHSQADLEIYDYPGEFTQPSDGTNWGQIRLDELQTPYHLIHGSADSRGIVTGCTFKLKDLPRSDQNQEYLVVSVAHNLHIGGFESDSAPHGGDNYHCSFTVLPATEVFRPARITPKPLIQGPQTALVVGSQGEEIYTDPDGHGCVKLKFHWDRYSKGDEKSSCWIRVSHAWAGKGWGAIYLPRVGQEVIVNFLEGDPDCPIVTGRVYNDDQTTPYQLPGEKTKSTLKSNSTKGGQGFNEIRFEDLKGSEQIFIQGEKNQDVRIKHDCFEWIGNDRHLVVKQDQIEHVEHNRNETVDNDHKESIGNDRNLNVTGKEAKAVGGSLSLTVSGDVIEVFQSNHSEQTTSDYYLQADNIVIEGMTSITIKVGQSYIAIDSSGISLGTDGTIQTQDSGGLTMQTQASASIQSSGSMSIQSDAQVQIQAPQTSVQADATLTLKGGMTMIN